MLFGVSAKAERFDSLPEPVTRNLLNGYRQGARAEIAQISSRLARPTDGPRWLRLYDAQNALAKLQARATELDSYLLRVGRVRIDPENESWEGKIEEAQEEVDEVKEEIEGLKEEIREAENKDKSRLRTQLAEKQEKLKKAEDKLGIVKFSQESEELKGKVQTASETVNGLAKDGALPVAGHPEHEIFQKLLERRNFHNEAIKKESDRLLAALNALPVPQQRADYQAALAKQTADLKALQAEREKAAAAQPLDEARVEQLDAKITKAYENTILFMVKAPPAARDYARAIGRQGLIAVGGLVGLGIEAAMFGGLTRERLLYHLDHLTSFSHWHELASRDWRVTAGVAVAAVLATLRNIAGARSHLRRAIGAGTSHGQRRAEQAVRESLAEPLGARTSHAAANELHQARCDKRMAALVH